MEDVKFSFDTWKEQTGGSPSLTGTVLRGVLKDVDVVGPLQVEVHLSGPMPSFLTCSPG